MEWRKASAALKTNCLPMFHLLPLWQQAWIVAVAETDTELHNVMASTNGS